VLCAAPFARQEPEQQQQQQQQQQQETTNATNSQKHFGNYFTKILTQKNPKIDNASFLLTKLELLFLLFLLFYYFFPKAKNIHIYPKTTIFPTSVNYTYLPEENVFFH
jgi:hypothetical protein